MCILKLEVNRVQLYIAVTLFKLLKFFILLKYTYMLKVRVLSPKHSLHVPFSKAVGPLLLDPQKHVWKVQRYPPRPPLPDLILHLLTYQDIGSVWCCSDWASLELLPRQFRLDKLLRLPYPLWRWEIDGFLKDLCRTYLTTKYCSG